MSKIIKNKRIAIVLFNLGGPDNLTAVKPFLFNLFNDKYIITLPSFLRYMIAWLISSRREKTAQHIYSQMGGRSTILPETKKQADALTEYLKDKISDFKVFICMRHWHPMSDQVIKQIENYNPEEIILLSLYPQFSTTTTASSIEDFILKKDRSTVKEAACKTICCYPFDKDFAKAHAEKIIEEIEKLPEKSNYRILFSAHGLPKKIIESGDPYQWQVERSVQAVIKEIPFEVKDHKVTYQSKVGPLEWIGPNTEDEIEDAAKQGIDLVIVPIAFVSEHSETLVELDIEYKEIADKYNIKYNRVATLGINQLFIQSLGEMVIKAEKNNGNILTSSDLVRICPDSFSQCQCKINKN